MDRLLFPIVAALVVSICTLSAHSARINNVDVMSFLITVNDTWMADDDPQPQPPCIFTARTGDIVRAQKSDEIQVGACDSGPLIWNITADNKVEVTFYSSEIMDAEPPRCSIPVPGNYSNPASPDVAPALPHCFVMDSREGYHMTAYWFSILTWN